MLYKLKSFVIEKEITLDKSADSSAYYYLKISSSTTIVFLRFLGSFYIAISIAKVFTHSSIFSSYSEITDDDYFEIISTNISNYTILSSKFSYFFIFFYYLFAEEIYFIFFSGIYVGLIISKLKTSFCS